MSEFDLEGFGKLFELVGKGGKTVETIVSLSDRVRRLFNSSKPSGNIELEGVIVELMAEVTNAKLAHLELQEELLKLREAALEQQTKEAKFEGYELWETPAGQHVYRLKQSSNSKDNTHYICPRCKQNGAAQILQGHDEQKKCPECEEWYIFKRGEIIRSGSSRASSIWDV